MIEPRCKHNWVTPPECPQCCSDERDQLRQQLEASNRCVDAKDAEMCDLIDQRDAAQKACAEMQQAAVCVHCGKPASCFGRYEDPGGPIEFACDECCGHGNEDGWCRKLADCGKGWVSPEKVKALE